MPKGISDAGADATVRLPRRPSSCRRLRQILALDDVGIGYSTPGPRGIGGGFDEQPVSPSLKNSASALPSTGGKSVTYRR